MLSSRKQCEKPIDARQVDVDGNVWTGVGDGVYVYAKGGELLGAVTIGEVSNLVFAGDTLIMLQARTLACADSGVWLVRRAVYLSDGPDWDSDPAVPATC